jgi:hypothetical protein
VKKFLFLIVLCSTIAGSIPKEISYQGILTDQNSNFFADGNYDIYFSIFDVATGGTALFTEKQSVAVKKGIFSVSIGSATPNGITLPFNAPYWLATIYNSKEIGSRVKLGSNPYSIRSSVADSSEKANYAISAGTVSASSHVHSALVKNGKADTAVFVDTSGNVGIGTISPKAPFSVMPNIGNYSEQFTATGWSPNSDVTDLYLGWNTFANAAYPKKINLSWSGWSVQARSTKVTDPNASWSVNYHPVSGDTSYQSFAILPGSNSSGSIIALQPTGGNVGIGTVTPAFPLTIASNGTDTYGWVSSVTNAAKDTGILQGVRGGTASIGTISANNMSINPDGGNVGIGTTIPNYKLSVDGFIGPGNNTRSDGLRGGINFTNNGFGYPYSAKIYTAVSPTGSEIYGFTNDYGAGTSAHLSIVSQTHGGMGNIGFYSGDTATKTPAMFIDRSSSVVIGGTTPQGYQLYVNGPLYATSGPWNGSDLRLKTNITSITDGLQKILSLQGVTYYWNRQKFPERNFPENEQIGLVAQDVEKIIPNIVHTDSDGFKSLSYHKLTAVLIEAVKEQQKIIENQKTRMEQQNTLINELQKQNALFEKRLQALEERK